MKGSRERNNCKNKREYRNRLRSKKGNSKSWKEDSNRKKKNKKEF